MTLVEADVGSFGLTWLDDGTIVFVRVGGEGLPALGRVPAAGGEPSSVWQADGLAGLFPERIPGRSAVLFTSCDPVGGCDLRALDLGADSARILVRGAESGQVAASGHLLFVVGNSLHAARFDPEALELRGPEVPLVDSLASGINFPVRISRSGTLVMLSGGASLGQVFDMVWVDRSGHPTPVDTTWTFDPVIANGNHGWALSPDGTRLAIGVNTDAPNIYVKQLPGGAFSRISFELGRHFRPRWTPEGQSITYASNRAPAPAGIYQRRADGTGSDTLLFASGSGPPQEGALSPDGTWLLLRYGAVSSMAGGRDITGLRLGVDTAPVPVVVTRFDEQAFTLSPDGRWLAYVSDETGRREVFVKPFPDTDRDKWPVSNRGGEAPLWSRDGRELFYLSSDKVMTAVQVTAEGRRIDLGSPEPLFRVPDVLLRVESLYYTPWDVAADGRFIMARERSSPEAAAGTLIVVENFFEELKAKVGH